MKGEGNSLNYTFRMHDPRIGRFFATDPLKAKYPFYSPYVFSGNRVIDAVELEGLEPKIIVTDIVTGYTRAYVYGLDKEHISEMVVKTYEAKILYTNSKGEDTEIGKFNVTRDGFLDIGTDNKGKRILANHSSDPANDAKLIIKASISEKYGKDSPAYVISKIYSPLLEKYNKFAYKNGKIVSEFGGDAKRNGSYAVDAMFHIGGVYVTIGGTPTLSGTFGCYGIIEPSQIQPTENYVKSPSTPSNNEMKKFGEAIESAQKMQLDEHGQKADVEVEIQKREYEAVKKVDKP